jgi:DNA polymerase-3 subunit epsilon
MGAALQALPGAAEATEDAVPSPAWRAALQQEVQGLSARLQALDRHAAERLATRWPREDLLGADLVAAALGRLQALAAQAGKGAARPGVLEVDDSLWLHADSHTLLQVLEHLARRLLAEFEDDPSPLRLQLRLRRHEDQAWLDLVWPGRAMSTETVLGWETEPLRTGGEAQAGEGSPLTVRDVLQRHGARFSFERDRLRQEACFRLQLPCAEPPAWPLAAPAAASSAAAASAGPGAVLTAEGLAPDADRPESYDFDLFQVSAPAQALDDRLLSELTCTVFDTETTGLAPAEGDQILQIGAVRVLRGRVLRHEAYEQLVDPQRGIPAAGIPIHGITPEMVRGQPVLEAVLPVFHAYAEDTVLVAHNAAFDMRFLQLAQARCAGLSFDHPVLDTLLLSAVVHPQQASHRLEHIAERFGVTVVGRHTALGDALVTAQIFVRLLPLLAAQGVHTLGQAREASRQTYYARLKY